MPEPGLPLAEPLDALLLPLAALPFLKESRRLSKSASSEAAPNPKVSKAVQQCYLIT